MLKKKSKTLSSKQSSCCSEDLHYEISSKCNDLAEMLIKKNEDYGNAVFEPSLFHEDLTPLDAVLIRISDKLRRIKRLRSGCPNFEGLDDTLRDIAGYCILGLIILERQHNASK